MAIAVRFLAGHSMVESPGGMACRDCGMTWASMLDKRELWVPGTKGVAHVDPLNQIECDALNAEVERIWRCVSP